MRVTSMLTLFFFFNDTATTEIYTLSLHDALPISFIHDVYVKAAPRPEDWSSLVTKIGDQRRSEEHTSELQSRQYLVCRLLLEKTKTTSNPSINRTRISRVYYLPRRRSEEHTTEFL